MKITLQQMRYMLKIAETGSMVAASRVLSVSQPSLSEAVSVVERELGFSLFTRGNTGATPTKEGMEFLGRARQVVLQMDNLERRYGGNQPEGMRFAVSSHHFTFVERAFLDVAQQVGLGRFDLVLNETQTQQIIDDVARCDSDLGVMYLSRANEGAVGRVLDRNKLEFYELFEAVPHVFLRFGHPLAGRESVSLDDLYPYPQLSFVQGAYESSAFSEEPLWAPSAKTVKVSDRGFATSYRDQRRVPGVSAARRHHGGAHPLGRAHAYRLRDAARADARCDRRGVRGGHEALREGGGLEGLRAKRQVRWGVNRGRRRVQYRTHLRPLFTLYSFMLAGMMQS